MLLPALAPERAREIISRASGVNVLVIGDAMVDKFIVGRVTRISPEAPVPVVAFDHDMYRIGGAANVASNVVALGGQATLVAVTGRDDGVGDARPGLPRSGHRAIVRRRRQPSDDDQGARRHGPQPAGRPDRLRKRR